MKDKVIKLIWFGLLYGVLSGGRATHADDSTASEYQIKAAFLYNFTKFVKWPEDSFSDPNAPFIIGILGENPFGFDLALGIKGKSINGHPLGVRPVTTLEEMKKCKVLFICRKPRRNMAETLASLKNASILTVSETDRFIAAGGMINFVNEGSKVRFEINDTAATSAGLTISSKLLNIARKRD